MEMILFGWTLTCIVSIAFNLFVVELIETFTLEIYVALLNVILTCALTFGQFYLSEWITQDLLGIGDMFYDSPWYRLPTKRQKLMVLPLQRAQRELRLKGLGLFDCSLAVFATVTYSFIAFTTILFGMFFIHILVCPGLTIDVADHSNSCLIFSDDSKLQMRLKLNFIEIL